jgi:GDPmannose 4,6-dehydratase
VKHALIIGSAGQDGSYLTEQLTAAGWQVTGVDRATPLTAPLHEREGMRALLRTVAPDAVYYLAAYHHSSEDAARELADELLQAELIHVTGWIHCLDAVFAVRPQARAFYAASSHCFGDGVEGQRISERTPLSPKSAYAATKAAGVEVARLFRARGHHVSAGFLFNHESPRRPQRFVSQRISRGAVAAAAAKARGEPFALELGSTSSVVDWGYAPDYTRAMSRIIESDTPGDFIIASGVPHSIADWCATAFEAVGLSWREHVVERHDRVTRQVAPLIGDASALRALGWAPEMSFQNMVLGMVQAAKTSEATR